MKYAIVEDGGKQFKAVEGETIEVDRYEVEVGDPIGLERVLMVVDGENITVGTPLVSGAKVEATVVAQFKGPKVISFKYTPKKRFRQKKGHRQQYTRVRIDSIMTE
jgi:large subunit ribosomal protein L21